MRTIEEITKIESGGSSSFAEAYREYLTRWDEGARDRETALRLLFLSWYSCAEPVNDTGLTAADPSRIPEWLDALGGVDAADPEVRFVVAVMTDVAPWCFGDETLRSSLSARFGQRSTEIEPAPSAFDGRGAYGEYFAHQLRSQAS